AAAWSQIKSLNLNHAQIACARWLLAQREVGRCFCGDFANCDRAVFPYDVISEFDSAFDDVRCRVFQRHVYLTRLFEHAEAARRCIEKCDERLRENVLSRVLLHVIETAGPI